MWNLPQQSTLFSQQPIPEYHLLNPLKKMDVSTLTMSAFPGNSASSTITTPPPQKKGHPTYSATYTATTNSFYLDDANYTFDWSELEYRELHSKNLKQILSLYAYHTFGVPNVVQDKSKAKPLPFHKKKHDDEKKKNNIKSFKCVCPACNNFVVSFFETKPNIWMVVDDHLLPSWVKNTKEQHNTVTCNKYNHILNQMVLINHPTFQEGVRGQTIKRKMMWNRT